MPSAPVADQRRLLDVQALDTRAQQLDHRRRTLPVLEKMTALEAELSDLDKALVASRTQASDLRREVTKAERDVEQVRVRAERDQGRLDSGAVGAKDAQALMAEIESLARRQAALEETQLEVMERLEAHEGALETMEESRSRTQLAKDEVDAELEAETALIERERSELQGRRATVVTGLDAELLALYDTLRKKLGGLAVARLEGRSCGGCRMELTPTDLSAVKAAAEDAIVRCEECGRILVRDQASSTAR